MSDDERAPDVEEEEEETVEVEERPPPPPPVQRHEPEPRQEQEYRPEDNEGKSEAELRMEMEMKKRREREDDEWKEYEEMRNEERKKEEEEIQRLREKKEKRKKQREEEERRMAELRAVEEQKRRAEEEERQRHKREVEQKRREEREKKKLQMQEQNMVGKRNFVINKRSDGQEPSQNAMLEGASSKTQQEMAKSKEQLENEKRAILDQRIQPLETSGMNASQLAEKAKELYHHIYRLEGDKYDLEDRYKRQQYDLMELAERARQMNKGSGKQKLNVSSEPDPMSEIMSGVPPKIVMYSQYERVKDRRSFTERREVYDGAMYKELFTRIQPTSQIIMTDQGAEVAGPYQGMTHGDRPTANGPAAEEHAAPQESSAEVEIAAE